MASKQLGTSENDRLSLPLNIVELKAGDLSSTDAIHGEQHQNRVIADRGGPIPCGGVQNLLHVVPGWSGRERLVLEYARSHDRSRNAGGAPAPHFGEPKK